jgi:bifunctional enzyme CysN/CysC
VPKEIFRITSAGSVDDGKSTILARLLLDTGSIYDDQLSKNFDPEKLADLLDGLESEREQGITIDVARRFFESEQRRYQIADSPGHEQYTRNMATACAGSDALMLVVDATTGLKPQTLHHLEIALRLGIRQIVFAINKMDLVGFSKKAFVRIEDQLKAHLEQRGKHFQAIEYQVLPVSGLKGDNVVKTSGKLNWFEGPTLLRTLDSLETTESSAGEEQAETKVFQVQYIQRLPGGGRRLLGPLVQGHLSVGESLRTKDTSLKVKAIWVSGVRQITATAGDQISLEVDKDVDIQRGELLAHESVRPHDQFDVDLVWLANENGSKSRRYILKSGSQSSAVSITRISQLELETNQKTGEAKSVVTNQIVSANIALTEALGLRLFSENQPLGSFVLIEPANGQTIGVGKVNFALRRSENITRQDLALTEEMHAEITGNQPTVIWFTGLSGSGKSTLANRISVELFKLGRPHAVLDGDNLRLGINKDLGFTEEDRTENIRRTAEIAKLMCDSGLVVLVALVSPLKRDRDMAKDIVGRERFELVYVDTSVAVCEDRDSKGLYKKARAGKLPNFTGVTAPFEVPSGAILTSHPDSLALIMRRILKEDWLAVGKYP